MKTTLFFFLMALAPILGFGQPGQDTAIIVTQPVGMTVEQFNLKVKTTTVPLLVNFTADWCVVCKRQKPVLDQVMTQMKAQAELMIIDMESNPLIAAYFEVDGLPVIILYIDNDMVWNRVGFQDKTQILEQLRPFIINREHQKRH